MGKWGYSGCTKSEIRRLVHQVKEKEDLESYVQESEEFDEHFKKNISDTVMKYKEF